MYDMDSTNTSDVWYDTYLGGSDIDYSFTQKNVYLIAGHTYTMVFQYGEWWGDSYYNENANIRVTVTKTNYTPTTMTLGQYTNVTLGSDATQWLEFRMYFSIRCSK